VCAFDFAGERPLWYFGYSFWSGDAWGREADSPDEALGVRSKRASFDVQLWRGVPKDFVSAQEGRPAPDWLSAQLGG